ncbi:antibiotic biosynthesis monooxygenase [Verrucomicrobia bacterium LW23]|nr:antibiotic biosynthesis monooxygenase [Verrucomicrobia bacterium LW23]
MTTTSTAPAEVRVVARIFVQPGMEDDFIAAFTASLLEPSRAEIGCLLYELHQDVQRPSEFVMFERWASQAALDSHFDTPHFKAIPETVGKFFAGKPELFVLKHVA